MGEQVQQASRRGSLWLTSFSRYPGVRCDVPSAAYQYTFESNTQWSEYYCEGREIERYFQHVAHKYGVYRFTKFRHMLRGAVWQADVGKWHLKFENLETGEVTDQCPVLETQDMLTCCPGIR